MVAAPAERAAGAEARAAAAESRASALAETLVRVEAERDRLKDQLWRAQAQIEAFTLRAYRLRERFNCSREQLWLFLANGPELKAE